MIGVVSHSSAPSSPERPTRPAPLLGRGRRLAEVVDTHAGLTPTVVDRAMRVASEHEVCEAVREAGRLRRPVCIAGGRHAMGGQAFRIGGILVDTRGLDRIRGLDLRRGLVEVDAGVRWSDLRTFLRRAQRGRRETWALPQRPVWNDDGTVGGAVSVNAHGLGLGRPPMSADVEALRVVNASGEALVARRDLHPELFRAAVGGYGLVGVITAVTLRLARRRLLRIGAETADSADVWVALLQAAREGALYGDAALCCDENHDAFLRRSVVTTYRPVDPITPTPAAIAGPTLFPSEGARTFDRMVARRLRLHGRIVRSDSLHFQAFPDLDARRDDEPIGAGHRATEILAEVCVPGSDLQTLLEGSRTLLRDAGTDVTRAMVRFVDRDRDTLWSWVRSPSTCVTLGVRTERTREGLAAAARTLSGVATLAVDLGGTFHPGFHRFASRELLDRAHPGFAPFLEVKRTLDPEERFQSDWYAHYRKAPAAVG